MSKAYSMIQTVAKIGKALSIGGLAVSVLCMLECILNLGSSGTAMMYADAEGAHVCRYVLGHLIEITEEERLAVCTALIMIYAAWAVVAGFALRYFRGELVEMTPFTVYSAQDMKILGIIAIAVPAAAKIAALGILALFTDIGISDISFFDGFVMLGIMFLVMSVIFRYGAGLRHEINAAVHAERQITSGDNTGSTHKEAVNSDESPKKIQSLARDGRAASIIVIAVAGLCILAIIIELITVTPDTQLPDDGDGSGAMGGLASLAVMLVSAVVVAAFSLRYFRHELADGTPFTLSGAEEIKRLGIITIAVSVAAWIAVCPILGSPVAIFSDISGGFTVLGVMYLAMSVVFRYGAELIEENRNSLG